ncbi:MAG: CBS domain-containing protein [Deltaproteobacteria bacterium]|nr:CBS domain-containing protein [Deltaproteobacteria bacterium]
MGETAREVMDTEFFTLRPDLTIAEAVRLFKMASEASGRRVFGMMVLDERGRLAGMLSIYDIFLLIRPKHTHIWGEMGDLDLTGLLDAACRRARNLQVGDIMTTEVLTVAPDTPLLLVIDIMIKKHVRRLPVVEESRVVGIVYLSQVFGHIQDKLTGG